MNRGELWAVAGGGYAGKPRPAVIIQDDSFPTPDSVLVAPLTSMLTDAPLLRIRIADSDLSGLEHESDIMIDKLTTVRRANVRTRIGRLSASQLVEVERALTVFLGLAR